MPALLVLLVIAAVAAAVTAVPVLAGQQQATKHVLVQSLGVVTPTVCQVMLPVCAPAVVLAVHARVDHRARVGMMAGAGRMAWGAWSLRTM